MANPQTRNTTPAAPANGDAPKTRKPKGPPTPPEKRKAGLTYEQFIRIALGEPRTIGDLIDQLSDESASVLVKALKALEAKGVVEKRADGKWARK